MDTTNKTKNRVQAYLSDPVYDAFLEYCKKEGFKKQSKAVEKILSTFLFEKENIHSIVDDHQDQIKDLESRLTKVEAIIKTKDYLGKEQINNNSIKVNNQDIE